MPKETFNYVFQGAADLNFKSKSKDWIENDSIISNGSSYADIDNDGDLDIISNNTTVKHQYIAINNGYKSNYLKLKLKFTGKNTFGMVQFHILKEKMQYKELQTTRGFQSSSEPMIHFGYKRKLKLIH
jgi:hypothetical protein